MKVNPVFVALNMMFLVATTGVWAQHGDAWWGIPLTLWGVYLAFCAERLGSR